MPGLPCKPQIFAHFSLTATGSTPRCVLLCLEDSQNDVLQQRRRRRLLFAFLAGLLQFAPSELTMFAGGQKDGNVIVILNLFISSGTRWSEEEATLYLFASPRQMGAGEGWFGALSRATFWWGGNTWKW